MSTEFSVIIPVWNEASGINQTLERLRKPARDCAIEVIVVDGNPIGDTLQAVERDDVLKIRAERGRATQMNRGAHEATGDILVFLHADTELPANAFSAISSAIGKDGCVGGAFDLGIDSGRFIFRIIERAASLCSRLTRIPYGDQVHFFRKDFFEEVGGYREMPLMEDVELMRRIRRSGRKIHIIGERVKTSARRWEREGVLYGTLRNWTLRALYLMGVSPEKLVKYYW